MAIKSLTTADVPVHRRPGFLAGAVRDMMHGVTIDSLGTDVIDGRIDLLALSSLHLGRMEGSPARVLLADTADLSASRAPVCIVFQNHGTSVFEQDNYAMHISPGDCMVYDMSRPFQLTNLSLTNVELITVPRHLLYQRGLSFDPLCGRKLPISQTMRIAHDLLRSIMRTRTTGPAEIAADGALADALLNLLSLGMLHHLGTSATHSGRGAYLLNLAKDYIEKNLADPDLSIDRIAEAAGCTKRYLHRLFREEGTSISRHIWRARLLRCRQEMETRRPGRTLTDIAFNWGFSSSSHFSRLFRRQFGFSPSSLPGLPLAPSGPHYN